MDGVTRSLFTTLLGVAFGLTAFACKDEAPPEVSSPVSAPSATPGTPQPAPPAPCRDMRTRLCAGACSEAVEEAIAAAPAETCRRWADDEPLMHALSRASAPNNALAEACARLVDTACRVAPAVCADVRSVIVDGAGTIDEASHCRKVLSSPSLMRLFAQRIAVIEFAAARKEDHDP